MLSVLIPVYNEEELLESTVGKVHSYLEQRAIEHEIVVTSNGSSDRTVPIGENLQKTHAWFRFFSIPEKSVGKAFRLGVENSRGDYLVCLDADLSSELVFLEYAAELLRHADMLVGSKTMGEQRRSPLRVIGSQFYILITLLLFDLTISDYSMGAKAFRRSAILPALPHLDSWTGYIFELCLYLKREQKKILQIGIDCVDRRKSRFSLLHEGIYRYAHLFRCWRASKNKNSWLYRG
ncbi:MAG: glycosyltransferase family 2 protein [Deltaproteobacteria bacterium]|nr:glycosyltransferase family 2 protein [Deltaproteobacteria bacterium]